MIASKRVLVLLVAEVGQELTIFLQFNFFLEFQQTIVIMQILQNKLSQLSFLSNNLLQANHLFVEAKTINFKTFLFSTERRVESN